MTKIKTTVSSSYWTYVFINLTMVRQQRSVSRSIACRTPIEVRIHDTTILRLAKVALFLAGSYGINTMCYLLSSLFYRQLNLVL